MKSLSIAAGLLLAAGAVRAQLPIDAATRDRVAAGSEVERYLRALQTAGAVKLYPWAVRGFGPNELADLLPADSTHPWGARLRKPSGGIQVYYIAPQLKEIYNTSVPYGYNDGPLWAGRGLTSDLQFGFGVIAGPLSVVVDPELFRAENRAFTLQPTGRTGQLQYADPYSPTVIDQPQRFGNRPYHQIDPGQTTVRLDVGPITGGFSTANEYWGPAAAHPIVLGNNAAGFPHVFLGFAHPVDLWAFQLHGRMIWGRLEQSSYSVVTDGQLARFGAGLSASVTIRGLPGLELGASRFYHERWPSDSGLTIDDIVRPLTLHNFSAAKSNILFTESTNQLASLFARWVFPSAGLEIYGEYGRDDYNADIFDLIVEPDHISSYLLGLQRVWLRQNGRAIVLRAELLNSRITDLVRVRAEEPFYVHRPIYQGHTVRGQVLGSAAALGGGGFETGVDVYSANGRWTVNWSRRLIESRQAATADMNYALGVERLWFGRHADFKAGVTQAVELNRRPSQDLGNLNIQLSTAVHW